MKYKLFIVFTIFLFYWFITIFFTIPENYLQIKSLKYEKMFSSLFYQKWSFFAPPPNYNERLYYKFISKDNKDTLTVEVLEQLNLKRKKKYLMNDNLSIVDYILSNSLSNITDIIREEYKIYDSKNCSSLNKKDCFDSFIKYFEKDLYSLNEINTLKNYGLQILRLQQDKGEKYNKFKILLTHIPINKFNNRFSTTKNNEVFIFSTKNYNSKNKLWEK